MPLIPGTDGVGTTPGGQTVFFSVFTTGGSFAEYVNVSKRALFPLPDGLDPVRAAALVNPALSSWMALTSRCNVKPGFPVCILGATSFSGRIAIQIARSLGASKIVGVARNAETLASLDLDQRAILDSDYVPDTDVILDYVYGPPTERILAAIKPITPSNTSTSVLSENLKSTSPDPSSEAKILPSADPEQAHSLFKKLADNSRHC